MKKNKISSGLIIVIVVHIVVLLILFSFVKKTYHCDEVWSFGIANSSVSGAVYKDENGKMMHMGQWFGGDVFHEYLTVQQEERFDFGIAYENAKNDYHPPLTFFLIHLIGSFFPDVFSFWFFIPFNILAMVLCDIYLYRMMKLYHIPESVCLAACVLNAFCVGGIDMAVYLRMYTLLMAFCMMLVYCGLVCLKQESLDKKLLIKISIINILGGLTCYEYFVFAFLTAFILCSIFLLKKRFGLMFRYGFTMLGGVVIALVLFPDAIKDMIGNIGGGGFSGWTNYPYLLQLKMLIAMSLGEVIGFSPNPYEPFFSWVPMLLLTLFYGIVICLPLFFFLRKEKKIKDFFHRMRECANKKWSIFLQQLKEVAPILVLSIVIYLGFLMLMNGTISVYWMKNQSTRYLFAVYPIIVVFISVVVYSVLKGIFCNKKWIELICVLVIFMCGIASYNVSMPNFLLNPSSTGRSISNFKNSQIILLCKSDELQRVVNLIDESNLILAINYDTLESYENELLKLDSEKKAYILIPGTVYSGTVLTDTMTENDEEIDYNQLHGLSKESEEENVEKIEQTLTDYFSKLSIADSIEEVGYERTINEVFIIYQLKKEG